MNFVVMTGCWHYFVDTTRQRERTGSLVITQIVTIERVALRSGPKSMLFANCR